jgi:hypothetical protein
VRLDPDERRTLDYFDLALHLARDRAARIHTQQTGELLHWQRSDVAAVQTDRWGRLNAACGVRVNETDLTVTPTCPQCRQLAALFDALEI